MSAVVESEEDEEDAPPRPWWRVAPPWQVRIVALAAIWGMSFVFMKEGDGSFSPLQVAFGRVAIGAVTLLVVLMARRERLPRGKETWAHLLVAGLLLNVLPFSGFAYGETHVTSILAGIWNATTPLFVMCVVLFFLREERPTPLRALGVGIGFAGVIVVLGGVSGLAGGSLKGNLACMGAALSYGVGFPYARKYLAGRAESVVVLSTAQLLCGSAVLAIAVLLFTRLPHSITPSAALSVLALGALGTGIAYLLNYGIIREAGASAASIVGYLIPLFSTVAGVVFLQERLTVNEPIGAAIVIVGVVIAQVWGARKWI